MEIDIESLTEEELIALNYRVVERLKTLRQLKAHQKMMDFQIGQRVWFESPEGEKVAGLLTRYNQKTVTVVTEDGQRWNVSPGLLKAVGKPKAAGAKRRQRSQEEQAWLKE